MDMGEAKRAAAGRNSALPVKCAACAGPLNSPVLCQTCGELQLDERCSHFELLGFTPVFELNSEDLRQRFIRLSRQVHPDRMAASEPEIREAALRASAQLNAAYEVLGDPLRRAEYLLELSGGPSAAADKSVPQDVLTLALAQREELEEAQAAGDAAAVAELNARVERDFEKRSERIFALARQLPGDEQLRKSLRVELNAVKYSMRFREQAQV